MAFQLASIDARLINQVSMDLLTGRTRLGSVKFQFPPIIKSDSKGIQFDEENVRNIEPVATFSGSKAREITLNWTYIVTDSSLGPSPFGLFRSLVPPGAYTHPSWTAKNIARQVKTLRQFFYAIIQTQVKRASEGGQGLAIRFRAYDEVGPGDGSTFSFRSDGVSVNFGDVIINSSDGYFPLRTDLSMKLKLWSKGETEDGKPLADLPWLESAGNLRKRAPHWY